MSSTSAARAEGQSPPEACPICHDPGLRRRLRLRGYAIVQCGKCEVAFALPRPPQRELDGIYADASYFSGAEYYLDYLAHAENHRRLARRVLASITPHVAPRGRLLDVGCAAGFFLDEAQRQGLEVTGMELSPAMGRHAREALGLDVRTGPFDPKGFGAARFHAITLLDSLEHFADPEAALASAHSLLRPGGLIAILTPNVRSALARALGARWPHYTPPEHLWYFSPNSLRRLLARVGFDLKTMSSLGHHWSLDELTAKLAPRARRAVGTVGLGRVLRASLYLNVGDLFVLARKI